jgi:hypothetical protein
MVTSLLACRAGMRGCDCELANWHAGLARWHVAGGWLAVAKSVAGAAVKLAARLSLFLRGCTPPTRKQSSMGFPGKCERRPFFTGLTERRSRGNTGATARTSKPALINSAHPAKHPRVIAHQSQQNTNTNVQHSLSNQSINQQSTSY